MIRTALISFLTNSINTRILSAYLKQNGFEVYCLFCPGEPTDENVARLMAFLREKEIGLVGMSLVTDDYRAATILTAKVKTILDLPVVWGGAHVNIMPEESLRHADMVCMGEGEDALLDLVRCLSAGTLDTSIQNLWFRTSDGIRRNELRSLEESLDRFPFPDFDLSTQYVMSESGLRRLDEGDFNGEYSIMTSRGCPYRCTYCYNSYRWDQYEGKGKYLRARSIDNVIAELLQAKRLFKHLRQINFWDDSFLARDMESFVRFREAYRKEIGLPFFALIEPMAFNFEKVKLLREAGLHALQVGIQSGSERVNGQVYKRRVSSKKNLSVAEAIKGLGIVATYDVIFNNPYETKEDLRETIDLFLRFPRPVNLQGFNLIFYPGSELTTNALRDGYISTKADTEDFSSIQSKANSPISTMGWGSEVSGRYYVIKYDSREKEYLNSVISLIAYRHVPVALVRFFAKAETPGRRFLLRAFVAAYLAAARLKHALSAGRRAAQSSVG